MTTLGERHLRVSNVLQGDRHRLNRLAASTIAFLVVSYVMGLRDCHDDNIMLTANGCLFRIDLAFAFGRRPEFDTPLTFVPKAVLQALGEGRWAEVVSKSLTAFACLKSARSSSPPAWDCISSTPSMRPYLADAFTYMRSLSHEDFENKVRRAHEWSLARATKNTLREAVRYVFQQTEVPRETDWLGILDVFSIPQEESDLAVRPTASHSVSSHRGSHPDSVERQAVDRGGMRTTLATSRYGRPLVSGSSQRVRAVSSEEVTRGLYEVYPHMGYFET
eukprot:TRINITY_DN20911_c0_g1_i4.p1 TRINITY_DN20911_c0_g1~~TRINITY_DN20911_c0_g1_i4.p1  ORF type:complete len:277 (-),score=16.94 TRINITY_DN20911_c0_g1_i4:268-1098(-)